jgi:hypothetical protein
VCVCVCRLRYPACNAHARYYIVICGLSVSTGRNNRGFKFCARNMKTLVNAVRRVRYKGGSDNRVRKGVKKCVREAVFIKQLM